MTVEQIRQKARLLKIKNYTRLRKEELIWTIQKAEGNADCYQKIKNCGQKDCCWMEDCQNC